MAKLMEVQGPGEVHHGWLIRCHNEECYAHEYDRRWAFDGDQEAPSFTPSLKAECEFGPERRKLLCHFYVTKGKIIYLDDCTHAFAGKTLPLLDWVKHGA